MKTMPKTYYVYIMASDRPTLYIGVTSNLIKRVFEHKSRVIKGFTSRYEVSKLVYFEETTSIYTALEREKRLKKWNRQWKLDLIASKNPTMSDLYFGLIDPLVKPEDDKKEKVKV